MEDGMIIDLYFKRSQTATEETKNKYGRLLVSISYGILKNMEDAEECENDTYFRTWNSIPPGRPNILSAFLSKIVRNLSLDRYDAMNAEKRGNGEIPLLLNDLSETLPERELNDNDLGERLNTFLSSLKPESRNIFMRRYWFGDSVEEIAKKAGFSQSKVKMSLMRSRNILKENLESGGYL